MTSKSIPEPSSSSLRNSNSDNEETNQISSKKHRPLAQNIKKQWNIIKLYNRIIDDTLAVEFAEELGLLPTKQICIIHNSPMKLYTTQIPIGIFQCTKRVCKHKLKTRAAGTLFEQTHLTVPRIFYLMYCFGRKYSYEVVQLEDFTSTQCLSTKTIAEWYNCFREMVIEYFLNNDEEEVDKVGGPGRIVQIDISKFGSRSYTRSKSNRVVDNWVLGIIEEGSEDFKLKVCTETIQNADVLIPLIKKHIHLGSTIVTDYSEIYDCISEHDSILVSMDLSIKKSSIATLIISLMWKREREAIIQELSRSGVRSRELSTRITTAGRIATARVLLIGLLNINGEGI